MICPILILPRIRAGRFIRTADGRAPKRTDCLPAALTNPFDITP
ncbi:hypothetical protein [Conchiformibius steedae]|nr:hypothetical protein [Conchiformibius steedae]